MSKQDFEKYEKMSKTAGKASNFFFLLMILGCAIPCLVIVVGVMLEK